MRRRRHKSFLQRLCRKSLPRRLHCVSLLQRRRLRHRSLPRCLCCKSLLQCRRRKSHLQSIGVVCGGNILRCGNELRREKYPRWMFTDVSTDVVCGVVVAFHGVVFMFLAKFLCVGEERVYFSENQHFDCLPFYPS